jgi:hypothetical protein
VRARALSLDSDSDSGSDSGSGCDSGRVAARRQDHCQIGTDSFGGADPSESRLVVGFRHWDVSASAAIIDVVTGMVWAARVVAGRRPPARHTATDMTRTDSLPCARCCFACVFRGADAVLSRVRLTSSGRV